MAADLGRFLAGQPIRARPTPRWERMLLWVRRRPGLAGALGTLLTIFLTAFILILWQWRVAVLARARADRNFAWARQAVLHALETLRSNKEFRDSPAFRDLHMELIRPALDFYDDMTKQYPQDRALLSEQGRLLWMVLVVRERDGQFEAALQDARRMGEIFRRLAEQHPEQMEYRDLWAWSWCWRGRLAQRLGRHMEAERAFAESVKLYRPLVNERPDYEPARIRLGDCYWHWGNLAMDHADWSLAARRFKAGVEQLRRPTSRVLNDFADLAEMRPWLLCQAHRRWAHACVLSGQADQAVVVLRQLLQLFPDCPDYWYEYALAQLACNDTTAYRKTCQRMLERFGNTDRPEVASRLVYTLVVLPDAVSNKQALVRLAELGARLWEGNVRILGACYLRVGKHHEAIGFFEQTKAIQPLRAWDWLFMSICFSAVGDKAAAEHSFANAQEWVEARMRADPHGLREWGWTEQIETHLLSLEVVAKLTGVNDQDDQLQPFHIQWLNIIPSRFKLGAKAAK
jgi:tetratricopeptide (TPR) repeat protein